jgi:hypothetical protein
MRKPRTSNRTKPAPLLDGPIEQFVAQDGVSDPEHFFADMARRAVYGSDANFRPMMRDFATAWLLSDRDVPSSLRKWLAFVLNNVGDLPHRYKGRPTDPLADGEFYVKLAKLELDYAARPKALRKQFFIDAEKMFNKSQATLKRARKSFAYKTIIEGMRKGGQETPPT